MNNPFARFRGYSLDSLRGDLLAGLVVAIVAIPLAIGFAIASGVSPAMGVITAIIGGLVAAIFGGSEFQISGPTGAMVVVILAVIGSHGIDGLIVATFLAGLILLLIALLRLGRIIEYIPSPVIVGFTAGIAVIIFSGQLNNFFGLKSALPVDASFLQKTGETISHFAAANVAAISLALLTVLILMLSRRYVKRVPGVLLATVITTLLVLFFPETFAVRVVANIGLIPSSLPLPHIPGINWTLIKSVLPAALTIAALSAIEALLSAVVADGMTDTKHTPNKELAGQGLANIASACFGGMPVTGAIARTATSVRAGARTRLAGIFHAFFILGIVFFIARFANQIPLPAIAGILMFTSFHMVEWDRVFSIFRTPLSDVAVMITTFLLTVLVDLTVAIEVGLILAAILFMKRMSDLYGVEVVEPKSEAGVRIQHPDISVFTISGPLFFGAASRLDQQLSDTPGGHKPIKIVRLSRVPVIDATGLQFLHTTVVKHRRIKGRVLFTGVRPSLRRTMRDAGIIDEIGRENIFATTREAITEAYRESTARRKGVPAPRARALDESDLTTFDREEENVPEMTDTDPVDDVLESTGLKRIGKFGVAAVEETVKTTQRTTRSIARTIDETMSGKKKSRSRKK